MLYYGRPTGAAMPLMWAHAEYIKLLRSTADGHIFDLIPEVANRYIGGAPRKPLEIWKQNRQVPSIASGTTLRIQAARPFVLHWAKGDWRQAYDTRSTPTAVGINFADIEVEPGQRAPVRFTFLWTEENRWEGRDYAVDIRTA
jgi:glucoamylase